MVDRALPTMMNVRIHLEPSAKVPEYADNGCSGADVFADIPTELHIGAMGGWRMISTGVRMEVPEGYEVQVRPRSGLAYNMGITILNSPGTIDSSYRGPIGVIMINHSHENFVVTPGMKIAQLVLAPIVKMKFNRVESLDEFSSTTRGEKGFGSTGL